MSVLEKTQARGTQLPAADLPRLLPHRHSAFYFWRPPSDAAAIKIEYAKTIPANPSSQTFTLNPSRPRLHQSCLIFIIYMRVSVVGCAGILFGPLF